MAAKPTIKGKKKAKRAKVSIKAPAPKAVRRRRLLPAAPAGRPHVARRPDEDPAVLKFLVLEPEAVEIPPPPEFEDLGELPESYGQSRVFLIARDPHWFYAYWDFARTRLDEARASARDRQLFLHIVEPGGSCIQQIAVPQDARNWFVYVGRPGIELVAELGYFDAGGQFQAIGRSAPARAPRDTPSEKLEARFVTIPMSMSFRELVDLVAGQRHEDEELADTLARLQQQGFAFPFQVGRDTPLSAEQREVLFHVFVREISRRYWIGSMQLAEHWRRQERVAGVPTGVPFAMPPGASPMGGPSWSGTMARPV
jgi:hypothetical protein